MKTIKTLCLLLFLFSMISCTKNDNNESSNPDVETYIQLLKSNRYDSLSLPAFTYKDIPALLQYRNESTIITNFPHNPISSLYRSECTLGMYVLWTIESIRSVSIQSDHLIMRFPSQNPILALRASEEIKWVSDDASHAIAADAYFNWWNNSKYKSYDDFKNIDPLKTTPYKWQ